MSHRSYLFVPGDRPERFGRALAAGADAVILDLEDAVAPERKAAARDAVARQLLAAVPVLVRINGVLTEWAEADLQAMAGPGLAGVMLPKTANEDDLRYIAGRLPPGTPLLPLIETPSGILHAARIAAFPGVVRLAFGSIDFQVETGIQGDDTELLYARSHLVLASAAAGIAPPVDGVTTSTDDHERVLADTRRAQRLGFGGKLCIHPLQVAAVHQGFRPAPPDLEWARGVLAALAASGGGAIRYQGRMVDKPVVQRARQILARDR